MGATDMSKYTLVRGGDPDDERKCWSEIRCNGQPMCDEDIVTALEQVPQWHHVLDSLPDDGIGVLVWEPDHGVWMGYCEGEQWWLMDGSGPLEVSHWMELPEGPNDA